MFTLLDTETTGLFDYRKRAHEEGQPRLCSIATLGMVERDDEVPHKEATPGYALIKPERWSAGDRERLKEIEHLHGLTYEKLMDEGQPIDDILAIYMDLIEASSGIAAYGVEFDTKVLRGELRRLGWADRYGYRPVFCINNAATALCKVAPTHKMMAAGFKTNKKPKLAEAYEILIGKPMEGAHNALNDLFATADIFRLMLARGVVQWKEQRK